MPLPIMNRLKKEKPEASKPKRSQPRPRAPSPDLMSPTQIFERQSLMYQHGLDLISLFKDYFEMTFLLNSKQLSAKVIRKTFLDHASLLRTYKGLCNDESRGFKVPDVYHRLLVSLYRLATVAIDDEIITRKEMSIWIPSKKEVAQIVKDYKDWDFRRNFPPPVAPTLATPPPVASSSRTRPRKTATSANSAPDDDYEDEEEDPATTDFRHGPSDIESDASEDPDVENAKTYGSDCYEQSEEEPPRPPVRASGSRGVKRRFSPDILVLEDSTVHVKQEPRVSKKQGKERASASSSKTRGKDKPSIPEEPLIKRPRLDLAIPRAGEKIIGGTRALNDGSRIPYQPPSPSFVDEDDGFVSKELSTTRGHVYLQGNVTLSYDSVLAASSAAPAPNYYSQGCHRCMQKGQGCAPRPDGNPGCEHCKSSNQKCSFTHPVDESLSTRDEHFDAGLQGHNGLLLQIEGILGTLASIQQSLDARALAEQGLQRGQQELERRRVLLKRSTRDPRILCALLRLLDPSQDTLDPDRLSILLTALQVRHSTFDIEAAVFQFTEDEVQIVDRKSRKVLAAYHPRELFMDSSLPSGDLAKLISERVGSRYLVQDVPSSLPPRIRGAVKDVEEPVIKDKSPTANLQPFDLVALCQALRTGSPSPARYTSKENT
ncbi:hypothetical protein VNI00_018758 [Paramarasmius palmivorus]|uniref:Zn(2)-C6 fungal-type domain-containing protein n=1 Tax=Paramarasmius palmivorus TaxID=297713 RepID=A0AAW0AWA4_9AGAR